MCHAHLYGSSPAEPVTTEAPPTIVTDGNAPSSGSGDDYDDNTSGDDYDYNASGSGDDDDTKEMIDDDDTKAMIDDDDTKAIIDDDDTKAMIDDDDLYGNETSGSGSGDNEGLIDDEDYYDLYGNETSGSGDYDNTTPPPAADNVVGGALQRRESREVERNDGFQLRRILTQQEETVRGNTVHHDDNKRGWSGHVTDSEIVAPRLPSSSRQRLEAGARDAFGSPVLFEYADPTNVYDDVPKSR